MFLSHINSNFVLIDEFEYLPVIVEKIQSIKGMKDLLPGETRRWHLLEEKYHGVMALYNYREIRIPVLEKTALFARSIGEDNDIVSKEMYTFTDTGGHELSLRPEGTAGVVRAYIQHSMAVREPVSKMYYIGPMFRRERPQKGRYRQFWQAGAELLGAPEPLPDVEQILMLRDYFAALGIEDVTFVCNHLGTPESRKEYTRVLTAYLEKYKSSLCEDCCNKLVTNPLRVMDCKRDGCRQVVSESPLIDAHRPAESNAAFDRFTSMLNDLAVSIEVDTRLVRGLDYYTGIVFEGLAGGGEGESGLAIVGGGRYDNLVAQLGGSATHATGYAIGLERLIDVYALKLEDKVDIFVSFLGVKAEKYAMRLLSNLRRQAWTCDYDPRAGSLKSQMKRANKLSARLALIVGDDELRAGAIKLKNMETGEQSDVKTGELEGVLAVLKEKMK